jgi:seryl-tRNA synthetase
MLDLKFIRENAELVKKNSADRLSSADVNLLLELDQKKRETETKLDGLRAERNKASKTKPTPEIIERMKAVGEEINHLEEELNGLEFGVREILLTVPNLTHPEVVVSADENANPVLETFLEPKKFDFEPKDHVELAAALDLIDFERATKVSGAKFYYLKNELALMEFALIQYALDVTAKHGFTPIITPDIARREVLEELGYSPRGESTQIYNIENSDLSLIGTAEITLGGLHQDEVLSSLELPKKYAGVSHCFRTEAGSYSKYSKGIFRVHQFTKIEMFAYTLPSESEKMHRDLLEIEKEIFQGLEIPFQVIDHCTADLGSPSYRTFDLEAWMPGKPNTNGELGAWGEITSTSNCTDFQARGLNIKYKDGEGNKGFIHTLNGTAISVARALIAILENHQQKDGLIAIPKTLQKYFPSGLKTIKR